MAIVTTRTTQRGVTMFVVLGSIILFTLLGVVALNITRSDNSIAGDLVKIKSQRMAAVSGFNLAMSRMQSDPANTVAVLQAFKDNHAANEWLVFDDATKPVATTSDADKWWELNDGESAVKVRILGISNGGTTGASGGEGVRIYLESYGKGKDGNVHIARGLYVIRGIDYEVEPSTAGPTNAFQSQGGLGHMHIGTSIDGGIYSGSPTTEMKIENSSANIKSIRVAGNVKFTKALTVAENSVIGGYLWGNGGSDVVTFNKNLIVRGGMKLDNNMVVKKSFYLSGCFDASNGCINEINSGKRLEVKNYFWIRDNNLLDIQAGSSVKVGEPGTPGLTFLQGGIRIRGAAGKGEFYGDLHTGTGVGSGLDDVGGELEVFGNLDYFGTGSFRVAGTAKVHGNAAFSGRVRTGNSNIGTITIDGNALFKGSIANGGTSPGPTISIGGETYLYSPNSEKLSPTTQYVIFGNKVSLNGFLSNQFKNTTTWSFSSSATNKTWSYNSQGLATTEHPELSNIASANSFSPRTTDEIAPTTWVTDNTAVVMPEELITPGVTNLGYTAEELDLSLDNNPASEVFTSAFPDLGKYKWSTIRTKYLDGTWTLPAGCNANDLGYYDALPSANGISCIYEDQKARGTAGILWNNEYLIIHQDGNGAGYGYQGGSNWTTKPTNSVNPTTGADDPGELRSGVKVFFIITGGYNPNSAGYWFSNPNAKSIQIIYSTTKMEHFKWKSTIQGYLYFKPSVAEQQIFSGGPKLIGSWENANKDAPVAFDASVGIPMSIEHSSIAAKDVFLDISNNFTNSETLIKNGVTQKKSGSTTLAQPIILFNGDRNDETPGMSNVLKLYDGWIQFERVGEYR